MKSFREVYILSADTDMFFQCIFIPNHTDKPTNIGDINDEKICETLGPTLTKET